MIYSAILIIYLLFYGTTSMSETLNPLNPCKNKPNCVSSQDSRKEFFIEPIPIIGEPNIFFEKLLKTVRSYPRAKQINVTDNYIHFEFRSALFGFVDDIEFFIDKKNSLLHMRSASRLGYSDFGVNRKRLTEIKNKLFNI
jgi:uncharacterized protein (DUF1499 family)